ncbi:MAG: hypothetical protein HQL16_08130 [Candidatus Omnitrophica bacterium]|nr:hypothetical protein [Candidatus Omnitrophota bacterium]
MVSLARLFGLGCCIFCVLSLGCALAAGHDTSQSCQPGYYPFIKPYTLNFEESQKIGMSSHDFEVFSKAEQGLEDQSAALLKTYSESETTLNNILMLSRPSRKKAEDVTAEMERCLTEINRARADRALLIAESFLPKAASTLVALHRSKKEKDENCFGGRVVEERIHVPVDRYSLRENEKELLGLSEDEQKYLKDFFLRTERLRKEYLELRARLNQEFSRPQPDRALIDGLLEQMALNIREDATNSLDSYFYREANIYTPLRIEKLLLFRKKHKS